MTAESFIKYKLIPTIHQEIKDWDDAGGGTPYFLGGIASLKMLKKFIENSKEEWAE